MDGRVLVPGEADEADLALALRLLEGLDGAAGREVALGVVLVDHFVDLPEVEAVGAQSSQRLLELSHRRGAVTAMRADLGHEEDPLSPSARQRAAHDLLTAAVVVFPRVVEEGDALVHGGLHDALGLPRALDQAEVIAAQAHRRHLHAGAPENAAGDVPGRAMRRPLNRHSAPTRCAYRRH